MIIWRQNESTSPNRAERHKMNDKVRTIDIRVIREGSVETYSKKDNSTRGYITVWKNEIFPGDYVVIDNYFTLVI